LPESVDAKTARKAVEVEVVELERLCSELERSLVAGDWNAVGNALRLSRRTTHDEAFDRKVNARMRRVFDMREDQLARLETFHGDIGERLTTLSRWKAYASSMGSKRAPARTAGFDKIR
jgi:hypothetical protein